MDDILRRAATGATVEKAPEFAEARDHRAKRRGALREMKNAMPVVELSPERSSCTAKANCLRNPAASSLLGHLS